MRRKRRLYRIAIIPAALVAVGITGATLSQADASSTSSGSCSSSGGLLSAATSALCAATSGVGSLLGGATGAATSTVTGTVGAVTGSQGSSTSTGTSTGTGTATSTGTGSATTGTSTGSAGTTGAGTAPAGTTPGATGSAGTGTTTVPSGTVSPASRKALARSLSSHLQQAGLPAGQPSSHPVTTVRLGAQLAASREAIVPHRSFWSATPLSLLIAVAIGLTVGLGIVFAARRGTDHPGRRRKSRRQYARPAAG